MRFELYYWPGIQGRGEFIRLALKDAGADYVDVARREHLAQMKNLIERAAAAVINVGEIFSRPALGRYARRELSARSGYAHDFYFWMSLLENARLDHGLVAGDVDDDLPFLLGRLHRLFPFLRGGFGLRRKERGRMKKKSRC